MKDEFRELWGPERAANRMVAKRLRSAIKSEGTCCVCIHRDKTFGVWHCQNSPDRQHPKCERDNGVGKFTVDADAIKRFQERGDGKR